MGDGNGMERKSKSEYPSVPAQRSVVDKSDSLLALNPSVAEGLDLPARQCQS